MTETGSLEPLSFLTEVAYRFASGFVGIIAVSIIPKRLMAASPFYSP